MKELNLLFSGYIWLLTTKLWFELYFLFFPSGDSQLLGIDFGFNPYSSILTSTLKLESKHGLHSTSSFGLLLVFQHLLINKSQPGWSPLALLCHATSIVLPLSRKELFPAVFLKLQECRGIASSITFGVQKATGDWQMSRIMSSQHHSFCIFS